MTKSLVEYWKDSCQIFKKDQARLFVLATLNNFVNSFHSEKGLVGIILVLFVTVMLSVTSADTSLWQRVFSIFSIKSVVGIKFLGLTKSQGVNFFGALFGYTLALAAITRPSLERKDGRYLLGMLFFYLPFFIVAQEFVMLVPFLAFLYMDMTNSVYSFFKALLGTARLLWFCFPVILFLLCVYGVLLKIGLLFVYFLAWLEVHSFIYLTVPLVWFVIVFGLFFSACSVYYTKIKHTERQLLFGE